MRAEFLPFSRPGMDESDIAAVCEVLRSGWITTGPSAAAFENRFRAYVGGEGGAVALTSATAGMHVVLRALGVGPGDEVVTPSMTWVSTANLITLQGATPVFADVDRDTLMVTPETLEACLTPHTRAVVPVHFAGAPVHLGPVREFAARHGLDLVEDAAHALGTGYEGERVGRRGTAIFSFHPIKNLTTGEGGMVCSDDEALVERVRRLKFHGLGVDAYDRERGGRAPQAEVLEPGYKYNLPDILAALGLSQLDRLDAFNAKRARLAAHYRERLRGVEEILPLADPDYPCRHAWHLFIVRLDLARAGLNRDRFMAELKARNIGTGIHFRAIHLQKYYAETTGPPRGSLPATEWNEERIVSLPLFPDMDETDVDDVVDAIRDVLARARR